MRTFLVSILAVVGCASKERGEARYAQAERISEHWCLEAELALERISGSTASQVAFVENTVPTAAALGEVKVSIDQSTSPPSTTIHSYTSTMANSVEGSAGPTISKVTMCKMKSHRGLEAALGIDIAGEPGQCREMNQQALDWALGQLTQEERERLLDQGQMLVLGDDRLVQTGIAWYGEPLHFTLGNRSLTLEVPALLVPPDMPGISPDLLGVHYCKLLTPAQMLHWVLHRAFWTDPLGNGPNNDLGAALVEVAVGDCRLSAVANPGSCIFYFPSSQQHYCEDYTGGNWTPEKATAKCASREEGAFLNQTCAERSAETASLDGDGVLRGECVMNCGTADEYRWNVYSASPTGISIESQCPAWFKAG